jgi:hypothetical protein
MALAPSSGRSCSCGSLCAHAPVFAGGWFNDEIRLGPPAPGAPEEGEDDDRQDGMSQADHLLLDFDHKEIVVEERRANPPKLQGVSGGGIFHIAKETNQGPLVAIRRITGKLGTETPERSGVLPGCRIFGL